MWRAKERKVYAVRPETNINGKKRILHRNLLQPCESILEEPEGLHLIQKNQNSSTSRKKGQGGEHERKNQDSDSEYNESHEEEGYTPRQLEQMEQTEFEVSQPYDERASANRQEIRRYKTRSRKTKDLNEVHFQKERVNSTLHNKRRGKARENNSRKHEQGQVTVYYTITNDERPKKKCKYTLRSHTKSKQTSHHPILNKEKQRRESAQLTQKQPKEWIGTVSTNQVNVVKDANLSALNGIITQMLTTNLGLKRTHPEHQDHIEVIRHSTLKQTKMSWVDGTMEFQCVYQITAETIVLVLVAKMATFGQCNILLSCFCVEKQGNAFCINCK